MSPGVLARAWTFVRVGRALRRVSRAPSEASRAAARRHVAELLADAKGIAMKAGQLGAALGGGEELRPLTEGVEGLPWPETERALEEALGAPIPRHFRSLEPRGVGASLGQVHRATLHDGREVAVKLRYPDVARAVESELRLATWIPNGGPLRAHRFDLSAYRRMLRDQLRAELDYRREANEQAHFREAVQVPGLVVPEVIGALSSDRLLVQRWEGGEPLESAATWSERERLLLAQTVLRVFSASAFARGVLHADPHAGNFRFRRGERPEFVLYDFGSMLRLGPERARALLRLLLALREGEPELVLPCLAHLGFDTAKLYALGGETVDVCRILFEPWLVDRAGALDDWRAGERVAERLGDLRWWFRAAAPPDSVLLVRAVAGLAAVLGGLGVRLPWWPVLREELGDERLAATRAWRPGDGAPRAATDSAASRARLLRITVEEEGRAPFATALPATEALHLADRTPRSVERALRRSGVRLTQLEERLRRDGLAPMELFDVTCEGRRFRAHLE